MKCEVKISLKFVISIFNKVYEFSKVRFEVKKGQTFF